jgi:4-methoxybenzoate monooxygenase (O-demethylating)
MTAVVDLDPSLDPFHPDNLESPYPYYARLRDMGPVLHLPSRGIYLATTHEAVDTAVRDFRTFSSAAGVGYPVCSAADGGGARRTKALSGMLARAPRLTGLLTKLTMASVGGWLLKQDPDPVAAPFIGTDPPEHTNNRRAVQPFFRRDAVDDAAPMVRQHVANLVDQSLESTTIDAVQAFSAELPNRVIGDYLGVLAPLPAALDMSAGIFDLMGPDPPMSSCRDAAQSVGWLVSDGIAGLPIESECPGRQIMEHGGAPAAGGSLAPGFGRTFGLLSIWVAALDTTASLIGNMLNAFAENPDQWQRLRANTALVPSAVEEALRFESPLRAFFRTATRDTVLCGAPVPAGSRVATMFASANRDPAVFADPDTFDIGRNPNPHLSFGASIHLCLGAPLARLEATMLLEELAARVQSIERAQPGVRTANSTTRGFASLPLRLVPA